MNRNNRMFKTRSAGRMLMLTALSLALAVSAAAQKKKKSKDEPAPSPAANLLSVPDDQKIDYAIGEMLGAWQVGDTEKLHKNIADDVVVVSGIYAPPVVGWSNYLAAYQQQRARAQQVRLDRTNTLIRISAKGTEAWACYQWDFSAVVDGQPSGAQGQTTLVFEKRGDKWLIVHNHTSLVQSYQPGAPANAPPQPTPAAKP